jgi:demethylmenaquinone methyltransferase/2-methoxy-6-polyprenyl-1,4-benzoquinol methylase
MAKKAIGMLKKAKPASILDVATGTGDMAIMACKILNPKKITGIDISTGMLKVGFKKIEKEGLTQKINLLQGDSSAINFGNNSFDAVMVAFGVRNFENLESGLLEMWRVLKPGGQLVILEFSKPKLKAVRFFYNLYMRLVCPKVVGWFRQNKDAYRYLTASANAFPERQDFIKILQSTGYADARFKPLSLGICCIYSGKNQVEFYPHPFIDFIFTWQPGFDCTIYLSQFQQSRTESGRP